MMKIIIAFALTVVAGVAALQDATAAGEAGPEPYSYAYQTDSHSASEQRDQQGRVTGFYTLTDADGRERRVEYVADEAGFRAKVATNEVGTKSESPANVEFVASEPTAAQYSAQIYQFPAEVQNAQYVRQQTFQSAASPAIQGNFARSGYSQQQQYAYNTKPAGAYGTTGYYTNSFLGSVPPVSQAYGGYGSSSGFSANNGYGYGAQQAPVVYSYGAQQAPAVHGYVNYPSSQYYSYKSQTVGGAAAPAAGYSNYRYVSQPAGAVTTTYRSVGTVPVASGITTYSSGSFPAGITTQATGFGPSAGAGFSSETPVGVSTGASRSSNYQGSSNYLVLQKRDAEEQKASN